MLRSLMIAVIVAITPRATSGSCTPGLNYCYDTLVKYNYDSAKLKQAVDLLNQPSVPVNKIKLHCNDDQSVTVNRTCVKLCVDGGAGRSDFCF
ncbi:hypothetical protein E4U19_002601 [Claviceps sp. Clav32 group G5]|nr:hypothetical protein E4U19_002601 [Claviceps sp. Clav32 group G5]KAG6043604.1 hypothetical protein E4U39_004355 [Claviceps sp. Clav50 group G5]